MKNTDAVKLSTGTKVYWYDPAGETSGVYEILIKPEINVMVHEDLECDDLILLIGNGYNEAEVLVRELEICGYQNRHYADNRKRGKDRNGRHRHRQSEELQGKVGKCFLSDGKVGPCGFGENHPRSARALKKSFHRITS